MKILESLPLNDQEKKLLKRVLFVSFSVFIVTIITLGIINKVIMRPTPKSDPLNSSRIKEITSQKFFNSKIDDVLPIDVDAHRLAITHLTLGDEPQKLIPHLQRILSIEPDNRQIQLELSTAYLSAGQFHLAKQSFSQLIETNTKDSITETASIKYGLALYYDGQIEKSRHHLVNILEKYPQNTELFCYLAQVEASMNKKSKNAEKWFEKSIKLDVDNTENLYQFARYWMNQPTPTVEEYLEARRLLQQVIEIEPLHSKAHSRLGMLFFYLGKPERAKRAYKTSLRINPDDYNTLYNIGVLYFEESIISNETLDKINTPKTKFISSSDKLYHIDLKKRKIALSYFKKAIAINDSHAHSHYKIGLILMANQMYKEAALHFKKAISVQPDNIIALLQLGVTYERLSMIQNAKEIYRTILTFDDLNEVASQKLNILNDKFNQ